VTAVAAPEAVSYASIAGLPAAQGLYTGFVAPLA
jgi:sulfate permease, SulP family